MPAELETSPQSYALKTVSSSITRLFVGQPILGSATWITTRTTRWCHPCLSKLQHNRNYIRRTLWPPKPWKIRTNCLNKSHGPWTVISGVHYAAFWTNGPNVVANIAAARAWRIYCLLTGNGFQTRNGCSYSQLQVLSRLSAVIQVSQDDNLK